MSLAFVVDPAPAMKDRSILQEQGWGGCRLWACVGCECWVIRWKRYCTQESECTFKMVSLHPSVSRRRQMPTCVTPAWIDVQWIPTVHELWSVRRGQLNTRKRNHTEEKGYSQM